MLDTGFLVFYESQYVQFTIRFSVKRFGFSSKFSQRNHHAHISRNNIESLTNYVICLKSLDKPEHL